MKRSIPSLSGPAAAAALTLARAIASAQQALTWDQLKAEFAAANPNLKADALGVDEMKAQETTALANYDNINQSRRVRVRNTVTYSYQHGGDSLMDFLNAQSDVRAAQLAYVQPIAAYLTAAGPLNLAVGREVNP